MRASMDDVWLLLNDWWSRSVAVRCVLSTDSCLMHFSGRVTLVSTVESTLYLRDDRNNEAEFSLADASAEYREPRESTSPLVNARARCGLDVRLKDGNRLCLYELKRDD